MKTSYAEERGNRARSIYEEMDPYAKAIRVLGHPSRHVLFDWVRDPDPKKKP